MNDTVILPRAAAHPQAGQRMSGAEMIVQVLADEGVSAIFGYSGGAILPTYDAVFRYNERRMPRVKCRCRSTCRRTSRVQASWRPATRARPGESAYAS